MAGMYVDVEIGGEVRQMRLGFNAVADLEEYYGKGITVIMTQEQVGFRLVRALYWAGLKWKTPGLTMPVVGSWIEKEMDENGRDLRELMEIPLKALKVAGMWKQKTYPEQAGVSDPN